MVATERREREARFAAHLAQREAMLVEHYEAREERVSAATMREPV